MRVIDADPLREHWLEDTVNDNVYSPNDVLSSIDAQPTVDALVVPCKLGDLVWGIRCVGGRLSPQQGRVRSMVFVDDMRLSIWVDRVCRGEWGKTVFATYEDACASLDQGGGSVVVSDRR